MLRRRRFLASLTTVLLGAGLAVGTTASAAAALYASPNGSGTGCTQAAPCGLPIALGQAAGGDDVYAIADQGDYTFSSSLNTPNVALHLHGFNGRARLIFTSGQLLLSEGTADTLYVEGHTGQTTFDIEPGASADHVFVKGTSNGHACFMQDATFTNSICWASSAASTGTELDGSNTLRNDTFIGGHEDALALLGRNSRCSCPSVTDNIVNVIARASSGGNDLSILAQDVPTTINTSSSNYSTVFQDPGSGAAITLNETSKQTAAPVFVDATAGDFHQASGSPTIDTGVNDGANGTTDLDGNPRTVNGTTDIGAYESAAAAAPPDTEITKSTIKPSKHKATFEFDAIGEAESFECALVKSGKTPSFVACSSPKTYRNLGAGKYKFKVRALSGAGPDATPASKKFTI
jgi:hypothetical protein